MKKLAKHNSIATIDPADLKKLQASSGMSSATASAAVSERDFIELNNIKSTVEENPKPVLKTAVVREPTQVKKSRATAPKSSNWGMSSFLS